MRPCQGVGLLTISLGRWTRHWGLAKTERARKTGTLQARHTLSVGLLFMSEARTNESAMPVAHGFALDGLRTYSWYSDILHSATSTEYGVCILALWTLAGRPTSWA